MHTKQKVDSKDGFEWMETYKEKDWDQILASSFFFSFFFMWKVLDDPKEVGTFRYGQLLESVWI